MMNERLTVVADTSQVPVRPPSSRPEKHPLARGATMIDEMRMMKEEEEMRLKLEAEAKERAKKREVNQTKTIRCTLLHGSRIGLRASKVGYGLGVQDDGGQCIVQRLVGVKYAEAFEESDGEMSPDKRFGPLQLGDRIVKVGDVLTPTCDIALETIKKTGQEPLELTILRDPNEAPSKLWRRDRLWNYSPRLYWAGFFTLLSIAFSVVCWIAYTLYQLEPVPHNATDWDQFDNHPYGPYGHGMRRGRRHMELR